MKFKILTITVLFFIPAVSFRIQAAVMNSSNYQIERDSINIGGREDSSSSSYTIKETLGGIGTGLLSGNTYNLRAGYRQAVVISAAAAEEEEQVSAPGGYFIPEDATKPGIYNVLVRVTHDTAIITWESTEPTQSKISWGTTKDYELGTITETDFFDQHFTKISGLDANTQYYFKIEFKDEANNQNTMEQQRFATLAVPDLLAPANVSNFILSVAGDNEILLTWMNPTDEDFDRVRVIRSTEFYPSDIGDGVTIYYDKGLSFTDSGLETGIRYYYTIFSYDISGNYSSGAVGSMVLPKPGMPPEVLPEIPPEIIPEVPPEAVPSEIKAIQLDDFIFTQGGKKLKTIAEKIYINNTEPLKVSLNYQGTPEVLKTILVTFLDEENKNFSFLLRINKEKTAYEAVLAAPQKPGLYGVIISILDYKNQALKKIKTSFLVEEQEAAVGKIKPFWEKIPFFYIYIIVVLVLLLLLLVLSIFRRNKKKEQQEMKIHNFK